MVLDGISFLRLREDGSTDIDFRLDRLPFTFSSWTLFQSRDGALFTTAIDSADSLNWGFGVVTQSNPDGSLARTLARFRQPPNDDWCTAFLIPPAISLDDADRFFITGTVNNVDGFPRSGLARLFVDPPERDFRVVTPARFRRNTLAKISVVRTGPSTNAASVLYRTSDGSAAAGRDYEFRTGLLQFAPLEVSKDVTVPLIARGRSDERLSFQIDLESPSAGYAAIPSTPVHILPDLRISLKAPPLPHGTARIEVLGTVPGIN